jgi:hypothetical protein
VYFLKKVPLSFLFFSFEFFFAKWWFKKIIKNRYSKKINSQFSSVFFWGGYFSSQISKFSKEYIAKDARSKRERKGDINQS